MNRKQWTMVFIMSLIVAGVFFPAKLYAYLDPGSGSYIMQLILAGLVAGSFAIKTFWRSVKNFFVGLFSKKKSK